MRTQAEGNNNNMMVTRLLCSFFSPHEHGDTENGKWKINLQADNLNALAKSPRKSEICFLIFEMRYMSYSNVSLHGRIVICGAAPLVNQPGYHHRELNLIVYLNRLLKRVTVLRSFTKHISNLLELIVSLGIIPKYDKM